MALIHCDFFSETLGISTSMYVILPQETSGQIGMRGVSRSDRHPTLYLLHGMSDDHSIWLRRTSIERYVAPLDLAVVMPACNRSFYTDMAHGPRYWTFLSEELPAIARSFFPLSAERDHNFAAGLSMGGYGAMKLGLRRPDSFAAVASLSGSLHVAGMQGRVNDEWSDIFGAPDQIAGSDNDLFAVAQRLAASGVTPPRLYQCCGTEDFLYENNIAFRDHCRALGFDLTYEEESGEHEWGYWDRKIQRVLDWLPLPHSDAVRHD